jgi:hypothetical protein
MSLAITNTNWWEKRSSNVPEEFGAQKHPFAHVWVDVKSVICQLLKIQEEFWSNLSEEMLSNTNAEPTTDFLDKTCSIAPMEENGAVVNPQSVPDLDVMKAKCIKYPTEPQRK